MRFDPSGLNRAFDTMLVRGNGRGKTLAFKMANFFVRITRKISREDSTPTVAELQALQTRKVLFVGVGKNKHLSDNRQAMDKEIARRIKRIGTFARGWSRQFAQTEISARRIRIWIRNRVGYSKLIDDRDSDSDKAAQFIRGAFQRDLEKLAKGLTGDFGK